MAESNRGRFLRNVKSITDSCMRLCSTDDTALNSSIERLRELNRQIANVSGNLLTPDESAEISNLVTGLLDQIERRNGSSDQDNSFHSERNHTGKEGAPCFDITQEQLEFLVHHGFTAPMMAKALHVSESTIRRRLRQFGISLRSLRCQQISDEELDQKVRQIVGTNQNIGPNSIRVRLSRDGIKVNRQKVRDSCKRVDPAGCTLRSMERRPVHRRTYKVAGPNSLWHIDGNHKLIRWQIVIHGCIDGFSRHINFLKASGNNKSLTVYDSFIECTVKYGIPSRVRVDKGGENRDVCLFMEGYRGTDRGSAIRGKSCHNQRIERLWVDVWNGVSNEFYDLFHYMENENILDLSDPIHRWALLYVFLPRINHCLNVFLFQYNNHKLSTESYQTPNQLFILGVLGNMHSSSTAIRDFIDQTASVTRDNDTEPENSNDIDTLTEDSTQDSDSERDNDTEDNNQTPFNAETVDQLQNQINIMENVTSVVHGLEIFRKVLSNLGNAVQNS